MNRERALRVVMVLVGLLFVAAIYPVAMSLWHASPSDDTGHNDDEPVFHAGGFLAGGRA
jgi:hypothetical protein